jgi:hypothetical protein
MKDGSPFGLAGLWENWCDPVTGEWERTFAVITVPSNEHQELYTEAVKGCERRLKRQAFIGACKEAAWLPIQLVATASTGLFHTTLAYPRRRWLRAKLKDRLQELDHPSEPQFTRQLQERIQAMDRG